MQQLWVACMRGLIAQSTDASAPPPCAQARASELRFPAHTCEDIVALKTSAGVALQFLQRHQAAPAAQPSAISQAIDGYKPTMELAQLLSETLATSVANISGQRAQPVDNHVLVGCCTLLLKHSLG